jgi:hypothetical protein
MQNRTAYLADAICQIADLFLGIERWSLQILRARCALILLDNALDLKYQREISLLASKNKALLDRILLKTQRNI